MYIYYIEEIKQRGRRVSRIDRLREGNVSSGSATVGGLFTCDDYVRLIS